MEGLNAPNVWPRIWSLALLAVLFSLRLTAANAGRVRVFGDPHFVGWDGVNFEFTGEPGSTYCMLSDAKLHINMNLQGRFDMQDAKNVTRTWIKSLGILFGIHRIALYARDGADLSHSKSFLDIIEADGEEAVLSLGESHRSVDGAVTITYDSSGEDAISQYDRYTFTARGAAKILLTARPEIPDLRDATNAFFHLSVEMLEVRLSPSVHGVLGQTYMNARGRRHDGSYKTIWNNLLLVQQVDSPNGEGYLDGTVSDYESSGLLHSDCRYSRFDVNADTGRPQVVEVSSGYGRKYLRGYGPPS